MRSTTNGIVLFTLTALRTQLSNVDNDLTYVIKTGNHLMGLVNQKYGVCVYPLKVFAQPATRHQ